MYEKFQHACDANKYDSVRSCDGAECGRSCGYHNLLLSRAAGKVSWLLIKVLTHEFEVESVLLKVS